jgi:hypothetical protein
MLGDPKELKPSPSDSYLLAKLSIAKLPDNKIHDPQKRIKLAQSAANKAINAVGAVISKRIGRFMEKLETAIFGPRKKSTPQKENEKNKKNKNKHKRFQ